MLLFVCGNSYNFSIEKNQKKYYFLYFSELAMSIEYCILAHIAFSQSCDIQGIGRVLRRAKVLTNTLTFLAKWSLMVSLFCCCFFDCIYNDCKIYKDCKSHDGSQVAFLSQNKKKYLKGGKKSNVNS
jgi:hypothetical protein